MNRSACPSCQASIVWCQTETGKRMPVDYDPVINGNVVFLRGDDGQVQTVRAEYGLTAVVHVLGRHEDVPASTRRYVAHFTTCTKPPRRHKQPKSTASRPRPMF